MARYNVVDEQKGAKRPATSVVYSIRRCLKTQRLGTTQSEIGENQKDSTVYDKRILE
jgi:hypothetical protein